jgi:membrane-bound lytic murein transglycosylase B
MVTCLTVIPNLAFAQNYGDHPEAANFVERMVSEYKFDEVALRQLMASAERKQSIIDAISRPAEKTLTWAEYRKIFIQDSRIDKGVIFWQANRNTLAQAAEQYGVPEEIIVAIIGVETRYGENKGSYRVLDALATLGFDYPPRATFFRKELEHFLLLSREQKQDPAKLLGSYAGAMGYGQFMPSSFRSYAVDFDGDQIADIWENPVDAIGSVGNYLGRHGWRRDEAIALRARVNKGYNGELFNRSLNADTTVTALMAAGIEPIQSLPGDAAAMAIKLDGDNGAEFWVGLKNFSVITRYNRSHLYAMAVYQLSDSIKQRYQPTTVE